MSFSPIDREVRQDVEEVLVRYATSIDRKDWTRFRTCFVEDCMADYGEIGVWDGLDAITQYMTVTHPEAIRSLHRITNVEVTQQAGSVTARSYVDVLFVAVETGSGVQAAGFYDDELENTEDGWKIARRRYTAVHMMPVHSG